MNSNDNRIFYSIKLKSTLISVIVLVPLLLVVSENAGSQIKEPGDPVVPYVEDRTAENTKKYNAEVEYNGGSISGEIIFDSDYFKIVTSKEQIFYWEDISSIRILRWVRYVKSNSYVFYPETYKLTLKSGSVVEVEGNIHQLNRFSLVWNKHKQTMFSYYYDEYIDGKWINSGQSDYYEPSTRPAPGCVNVITFR